MKQHNSVHTLFFEKIAVVLTTTIIIFFTGWLLYSERAIFQQAYNVSYWKNRFEHSQYALPLSKRTIGDDGLYAYAGYNIVKGDDPTKIVFDKGPVGLFLIGLFGAYLANPPLSGLVFGIGSVIVFFFIALRLLSHKTWALIAATMMLLDPLLFNNFWKSLLDGIQLFFMLLNILFFLFITESKRYTLLVTVFSGLALGVAAQVKIPVFFPVLFLLQLAYLLKKSAWKQLICYLVGLGLSVLFSYLFYMRSHYSPIAFLKIQKHILSFYQNSSLPHHPGAIWQAIFTGTFPNISSGTPEVVNEWSLLLPIFTVLGIIGAYFILHTKDKYKTVWRGIVIFLLSLFIILTIIPLYPRYILILTPFLLLLSFYLIKNIFPVKMRGIVVLVVLTLGCFRAFSFFITPSDSVRQSFYYNFSHKFFQDIYQEQLIQDDKRQTTQNIFYKTSFVALKDASIQDIAIKEQHVDADPFAPINTARVRITYFTTYLGSFSEEKTIRFVKEDGQWKVDWQWSYLLNGFHPGLSLATSRIVGKRGTIRDKKNAVLAEDQVGYLLSFNPDDMDQKQETEMLKTLSKIRNIQPVALQEAYLGNVPDDIPVPLLTSATMLDEQLVTKLHSFKGLTIEAAPTRIYSGLSPDSTQNTLFRECCTRIYSSYNYHGKGSANPEQKFDRILSGHDGGYIRIVDKKGKIVRTIVEKTSKDGQNIRVDSY